MNRQNLICLLLLFLIPFFYPFWYVMSLTGWVFYREEKEIVKFLWKQTTKLFHHTQPFKIKDWLLLFLAIGLAHIPYFIAWKLLRCIWIVYFKPYV